MNLKIKELSHDKLIELIENLILEVNQLKELKEENQKLKAQLGLNSSNSSKPPSTDYFKKKRNYSGIPLGCHIFFIFPLFLFYIF